MIFSQVTLQVETTVKKKNGAEANVIKLSFYQQLNRELVS